MPSDVSETTLQVLGGYDLLQKLADGGMGSVYRGRNRATGEIVAIKVMNLPSTVRSRDVLLRRFLQEFRAASALDHPNVVRALDFGWQDRTPYLVMEFVDGETLGARLKRVGRLPEQEALDIVGQVAAALEAIHARGLIHRDVKPDNVLLTADGQAKLTDLGLVKDLDTEEDLTRTGRGLGTPYFMAPEQFRNARSVDLRSDIYALAATLYTTVTGTLPFGGGKPVEILTRRLQDDLVPPRYFVPSLSERLDGAIRRALRAEPSERPASCREFLADLTRGPCGPCPGPGPREREVAARPTIAGSRSSQPTDPLVCPPTPALSATPPVIRVAPAPVAASDSAGERGASLTWLTIAVGLAAGLLVRLYLFPG
jgi:serine/threonine protein kinase